ncbi:PREDICTED: ATP-dependent DNA helicase Q4 [Nanorana parkeri]|uniref:ATP-dependent DNA helicase Q4 n=1 Tax=Nanorana parkeri TaxID=125878 RepID=UPI000854B6A5|nr:PREDICTED: ATP-dependent DNA helicase Q4 [Nanorana parkeri]
MMDRYAELKLLLKTWEGDFLKEHERKPTKADIEHASQETQDLYKEFRALKQKRPAPESVSSVQDRDADQDPEREGPDSWGSHLNRSSVTPKMSSSERDTLHASAQYYGMKLKSNLGGAGKNRPLSLKKTINRSSPISAEKKTRSVTRNRPLSLKKTINRRSPISAEKKKAVLFPACDPFEPSPAPVLPAPSPGLIHDDPPDSGEDLPFLGLKAPRMNVTPSSHDVVGKKLHQLQSKVGQRLSSLDHDWLQRCEVRGAGGAGRRDKPIIEDRRGTPAGTGPMGSQERRTSSDFSKDQYEVRHDVKSLDDTKTKVCVMSTEETPRTTSNAAENKKISEPLTARWQSHTLGKVETNTEEQKMVHPSEKKEVLSAQEQYKEEHAEGGTGTDLTSQDGKIRQNERVSHRKRRRDPTDPPDSDDVPSQKRQRAKLTGEKSRKRGSKKSTVEEVSEDPPKSEGTSREVENILGEVMEEGVRRVAAQTQQGARGTQRGTENFVRINLKKKSHVKNFVLNGSRLRKQMWKQKWQKKGEQFGGGGKHFNRSGDTCFHCGVTGHWASQCPGKVLPVPKPEEPDPVEEDIVLPSLEDVARMTNTQMGAVMVCEDRQDVSYEVVRPIYEPVPPPPAMTPLYELDPSGTVRGLYLCLPPSCLLTHHLCLPPPVFSPIIPASLLPVFSPIISASLLPVFSPIISAVSGLSSLVILSTGMGKSLCYQLPAFLYSQRSPCISLVISPLVSLMDDQVSGLPSKLQAVCIHSNMTKNQREVAMDKVKQGKVHVLLLSPEALVGGGLSGSSCLPPADQLPPVAFACIDEVHCVSEWSHNFRPCYLRLCKVLRERLGVRCLLGLTATATLGTAQDVARHLEVSDIDKMPLRLAAVPPNLHLSVSMDQDRDQALVTLLKGERFGCLDSIIIYCTRREETQRLAALLRTCLQGVTVSRTAEETKAAECDRKKIQARKKIRRPLKWMADTYHAGLSAAERRRVQNNFMSGQLRIVVATVAFGMGLDKSDVRGIIHYNMPKNFESYVQEIGRAGRDGNDAHCHLFLDPHSQDLDELRRHVYADSVEYITVKKLVQRVFPKCKCRDFQKKREALRRGCELDDDEMLDILAQCEGEEETEERPPAMEKSVERMCHRHERVLPIEETVQALDVREEGLETLLCYLELHPSHWLELLYPTLSVCRVTCYSGPQQLRALAHSCPPVAVALARERLSGIDHTHASSVEFNVVEVADSMAWEVNPVKRALRDLQWNSSSKGGFRGTGRSGVLVEFSTLSFHFRSYGDLTNEELEEICDFLHQKVSSREATALRQLKTCYRVFQSVAYRSSSACAERVNVERSAQLKAHILDYFEGRNPLEDEGRDEKEAGLRDKKADDWMAQLSCDVRLFLSIHPDERFSGRAIARIFHGIGSPCYPAQVYGRDRRFWRKYLHLDFNKVMQACKEEVIRMR